MEENNPLPQVNPVFKSFTHLLILVGMYLIFAVLAVSLAVQITLWVTGVEIQLDFEQIDFDALTSTEIFGYKLFQLIGSIGTFIATALVFAKLVVRKNASEYFGFTKVIPPIKIFGLVILIALSAIPFLSWVVALNKQIPLPGDIDQIAQEVQTNTDNFYGVMLHGSSIGMLLFNLLLVALVPAVGEELLFRGGFMQIFYRLFKENIHAAIIVSAILFSLMHLHYYNFIGIIIMGVIFGYLYYWSGNIMVSIWAHFINNSMVVLFSYLTVNNPDVEFLTYDYEFSPTVAIGSGIIMIGAIYRFYKTTRQYHAIEEVETDIDED